MDKFAGECRNGPYHGQKLAHWSKRKVVLIKDGAIIREGAYEFFDGVWLWCGPRMG
jgi:hypothetical protein